MDVYEVLLLILTGGCLAALVACAFMTGGCAMLLLRSMQRRSESQPQKERLDKTSRGKGTETDVERKRRIAEENLNNFGTGIPQKEVI